ncbi:Hypothetical predicted protein, partial [Paramuricea clavata]
MAQGIEPKQTREYDRGRSKPTERGYRPRTWFTNRDGKHSNNDDTRSLYSKPPCAVCGGNHGVWSYKLFSGLSVPDRWGVAKEKHLCFRCLASNHVVVPKEKEEGAESPMVKSKCSAAVRRSLSNSVYGSLCSMSDVY